MTETCSYDEKYKAVFAPRNNCATCWSKYFSTNVGIAEAASSTLRVFGYGALVKSKGKKWADNFRNYLGEVMSKEAPGLIITDTDSLSPGSSFIIAPAEV